MKHVLANLGFLMQMAGIFVILPIISSFIFNEMNATIALFIAATVFLSIGFLLNAFCERKDLSYKQSCSLIVIAFVFLSVVGAIPYIYLNISEGGAYENLTDSIFESTSGFTTTGFSVINNVSTIPQSIIFYRALTQFIGGIGIVLILLAFFYPEVKLHEFARSLGFLGNHKIKKTFLKILLFYVAYCVIMICLGVLFGYHNILYLVSFIFSALSTGGFSPINNIASAVTKTSLFWILIFGMLLGAANFLVVADLLKKRTKAFLKSEVTFFLIFTVCSIALTLVFFNLSFVDATFHIISAMTTTGFSYISMATLSDSFKLWLILLMFIGGTSLSTAGGIKIFRVILLFKIMYKTISESITKQDKTVVAFGKEYSNKELFQPLVIILLMIITIFCSAGIICGYGFQPVDAIFEATSAVATTGLSTGIVGPSLATELKWLFIFLMILGRVEIFTFLIMLSRKKEKNIVVPAQKI